MWVVGCSWLWPFLTRSLTRSQPIPKADELEKKQREHFPDFMKARYDESWDDELKPGSAGLAQKMKAVVGGLGLPKK